MNDFGTQLHGLVIVRMKHTAGPDPKPVPPVFDIIKLESLAFLSVGLCALVFAGTVWYWLTVLA